jgi:hypothetical protein
METQYIYMLRPLPNPSLPLHDTVDRQSSRLSYCKARRRAASQLLNWGGTGQSPFDRYRCLIPCLTFPSFLARWY